MACADAFSRCPTLQNCQCVEANDASLACRPCSKCKKKAQSLQSRLIPEYEAKVGKLITEDEKVSSNKDYNPKCEVSESTVKQQVLIWTEGAHREEITNFPDPSHTADSKCARVQMRRYIINKEAIPGNRNYPRRSHYLAT